MFTLSKPNMITSDEGYSVEILGRTGLEYREGNKSMFVDSEVLGVGHGIVIFSRSMRTWRAPNENEVITEKKRGDIIKNIRLAIEFQKQPVEVQ